MLVLVLTVGVGSGAGATDLPIVSITAVDGEAREPGDDTGLMRVHRSGDTTHAITVELRHTDYGHVEPLPAQVVLDVGQVDAYIEVRAIDDDEPEVPRFVRVDVVEGRGYEVDRSTYDAASARVTVIDDEPPVLAASRPSTPPPSHPEGATVTFRGVRLGDPDEALTVGYRLSGTATPGQDVSAPAEGTFVVEAGQTWFWWDVEGVDDDVVEGVEELTLTLLEGDGYSLRGDDTTSSQWIADNEDPLVQRLGGEDRVETAVVVSQHAYPEQAAVVVIARADDYADALAGGPLAYAVDGPILLTPHGRLEERVGDEIQRLGAERAILLGGSEALSTTLETDLRRYGVTTVERVGGADRFETAGLVADRLASRRVYAVEASAWPDAVSISALAARQGRAIVLVRRDEVPRATREALARLRVDHVTVVGGFEVLPEYRRYDLMDYDGDGEREATSDRIAGADRYHTSRNVFWAGYQAGASLTSAWFVTGRTWADALVAGPAAASESVGLMLVEDAGPDGTVVAMQHLRDRALVLRLVGGVSALDADTERALRQAYSRSEDGAS